MNPENQGNGPDSSSNIFKRKRGRPRKDQSQHSGRIANALAIRDCIQGRAEHAHVPPGFERVNGNRPQQENAANHNDDPMVGQTVTGVIEASFDAGYLLSVRVGNSENSLRGVVFKPGHYVPVSTENDLAPHIQMIRRNAVPFPAGYHTPVHGSYRRGRGRGRARSESRLAYSANGSTGNQLAAYSAQQLQLVPAQPSSLVGTRGTVVPVVLQPANPSTIVAPAVGTPPAASQPAHLASSKAKQINQTEVTLMDKDMETDNGSSSTKQAHDTEDSTVKLPGGVTEELLSEVGERIQGSSPSKETRNESEKSSDPFTSEQMQDLPQPLMVKPLQAIWSDSLNQSSSIPQNFRDARAGKMTELLLAVQENLIEKQAADAQHHDFNEQQN